MDLKVEWLGRMGYREAWARQRAVHASRDAGDVGDTVLLVEHPPVLTLGRHASDKHVLASPAELEWRGIEVIRVERGGEVTFHGPGQLVAYPIVHLRDLPVLLRPFVRALELSMGDVAAHYGVLAASRQGYPGAWIDADGPAPRKLGALGVRVERGITYHGIALNITTYLPDFNLIDPCGMAGLDVTSVARELGWQGADAEPSTEAVRESGYWFAEALSIRLDDAVAEFGRATCTDLRDIYLGVVNRLGVLSRLGVVVNHCLPSDRGLTGDRGHGAVAMAGGLFELRRDDITGWWVAVVVDREFDRARFAREAAPVHDLGGRCQNCRPAPDDGTRLRMLKPKAFTVAGSELEQRRHEGRRRENGDEDSGQDGSLRLGLLGDAGSWETIVAPLEHHVALGRERESIVIEMLRLARDRIRRARDEGGTDYLQVVQNWGKQAGAMTNHLCFDIYDLPQILIASARSSAARRAM